MPVSTILRAMNDGIICIDKPEGFTSFDVIAKARGILKTKKIGHSGTLDPMATGVLPLFIGKAARAVDLLSDTDKAYLVTFQLGITTDTLDSTGTILSESPVTAAKEDVREGLTKFVGDITQIPPMYSAVKVGGQRLYKLAREGREIERQPRPAKVHSIELMDAFPGDTYTAEIHCGAGTYVRVIVDDLGKALGCGAVMTALVRTKSGCFTLSDCISLRELQEDTPKYPIDSVLGGYPKLSLIPEDRERFLNGVKVDTDEPNGLYRVYDSARFLALGGVNDGKLKTKKLFIER